jgi:hypothetical protein
MKTIPHSLLGHDSVPPPTTLPSLMPLSPMASSRSSSPAPTLMTTPLHGRDDNNAHTALPAEQTTNKDDRNKAKAKEMQSEKLITTDNNEGNEVEANKVQSKELLSSVPSVGNMSAPDLDVAYLDEAPPTSIGVPGAHMQTSSTASRETL